MRALVKPTAGPGLELMERPEPLVGTDDVKIRVQRAGLCGTDLHLEQWDDWAASVVKAPLVIGHEFFGEVVEIGQDVTSVQVGQKASGEGHEVAKAAGADLTVNVSRTTLAKAQRELGMREGFDIGLEMSGSPLAME